MIIRFLLIAGLWATFQAISLAQNVSIKPGLWEMEQVIEMPGDLQGGFKNQWQYCVKEEVAQQGPVFSDLDKNTEGKCRIENLRHLGPGRVTYTVVCEGEGALRIETEFRYTETTFEGTVRAVSEGESFVSRMNGRHLGPCEMGDIVGATERILDWAERNFPQLFPSSQRTQTFGPWLYRYYPETGIYAGINREEVAGYVLGGPFGNVPRRVASVTELLGLCGC